MIAVPLQQKMEERCLFFFIRHHLLGGCSYLSHSVSATFIS